MDQLIDAPMIMRETSAGGFFRVNEAFRSLVGFSDADLASKPFLDWIEPEDREAVRVTLLGGKARCCAHHKTLSGDAIPLTIRASRQNGLEVVLGHHAHAANLDQGDPMDTEEVTVSNTLNTIALIVEAQNPGFKCSILLVEDGRFIRGAGPSLPENYNAAIDGHAIGPAVGSCGTAIYWNVPVIVTDIQADPLWIPFTELAREAGVGACWSHPFTSTSGRVLGALALYAPEPLAPTNEQLSRLRAAAQMTGLAVERGRAEEALREQRKREMELEEQLRQAAKMEALGVLAGGVAHDFNNVLMTITGNAEFGQMLLEPEGNKEVVGLLESILTASRRAAGFCDQLLAYAGHSTLATSRIEFSTLLSELDSLVKAAVSKKTTLEFSLHHEPVYIEGDENHLLQVIMNLVTNAAEAIGDNEGRIVVRSDVAHFDANTLALRAIGPAPKAGEFLRLTVSDTGCGLDDATAARIFDPFFTTKFTGRGLGLAAVKGIVLKHHGAIWFDSTPGVGTTFTLLLPRVSAPEPEVSEAMDSEDIVVRKLVLVVDDERSVRRIFCRLLEHSGFDVLEACDGQEAIDVFRQNHSSVACVLLDLSMPKLSGEEVFQEMRTIRQDVKVVLTSGFSKAEIRSRFEGDIPTGVLKKPVAAKELLAAIRTATAEV